MLEGVIHDITARRLAAEQQAELDGQIQQTQRLEALGRMAGGVAHDFNNTLTVIIGNAELIREPGTTDDEREASLTAILKAGQHAATLVKRLLGFAARQTSLPRSIDLNHAISAMTEPLEQALGPNIQLAWRPSEALWPVMIDPDQVAQVLIIFADNARDAMRGEGTVTVETANVHLDGDNGFAPAGDYVRLSFRDTGCGMVAETQTKIFDPFDSTKPDTPETGMGLAIVYGIVKQNRGFIRVSSQPGDGTLLRALSAAPRPAGARARRARRAGPRRSDAGQPGRHHDPARGGRARPAGTRATTSVRNGLCGPRRTGPDGGPAPGPQPHGPHSPVADRPDHARYERCHLVGHAVARTSLAEAALHVRLHRRCHRATRRLASAHPFPAKAVHARAAQRQGARGPGSRVTITQRRQRR